MNSNKIRSFIYRHSIDLCAITSGLAVVVILLFRALPAKLSDKGTLITISVTLAGFMFTGQGIMMTLPKGNEFVQLLREHGYLSDFHNLCSWSEVVFIGSVILGLDVVSGMFFDSVLANLLYLFAFLWGLLMALWALWLFGSVIGGLE